jgi:parallel beta-helix repeat protein
MSLRMPTLAVGALFVAVMAGLIGSSPSHATTVYSVNVNTDSAADDCLAPHNCSLRGAINLANTHPGADEIHFSIGTGPKTIAVASSLPKITEALIIDGETQPSVNQSACEQIQFATPCIRINGTGTNTAIGFDVAADNVELRHMAIYGFLTAGIGILVEQNVANTKIVGNYVGTLDGVNAAGNQQGIFADTGSSDIQIGGSDPNDRNLVSGNQYAGVDLLLGSGTVQGNYIGTDWTGTAPLPNTYGIAIEADGSHVGGTAAGEGNLISGNTTYGIFIMSANNVVEGNLIGTDYTGTAALGNGLFGIDIKNEVSTNNTIGGTTAGSRNVISGQTAAGAVGIEIDHGAANNTIQGNYIGTNVTGTSALPNASSGIVIKDSSGTHIGGTTAGARNVISGNGVHGVHTLNAPNTLIEGNYVGTNAAGTAALANASMGIDLNVAPGTVVGGATAGARNVLSGNGQRGVRVGAVDSGDNVTISGNYIGTNAAGTAAIPNGMGGVLLDTEPLGTKNEHSTISGNVISGNTFSGIYFQAQESNGRISQNDVYGNIIGLNAEGTSPIGNGQDGIKMQGTNGGSVDNNNIGVAGQAPNVIAGNGHDGIAVLDGTADNLLTNNIIGINEDGDPGLGNGQTGINVQSPTAVHNTISQNSIDNNTEIGIDLTITGNGERAAPHLDSAVSGSTNVKGSISNRSPNAEVTVEFFWGPVCDPSGFGEGRTYIGTQSVGTNGAGAAAVRCVARGVGAGGVCRHGDSLRRLRYIGVLELRHRRGHADTFSAAVHSDAHPDADGGPQRHTACGLRHSRRRRLRRRVRPRRCLRGA